MPLKSLLYSRKFWIMVTDLIISLVIYFTVKYASPTTADDIKFVIGVLQVPVAFVIGAIAFEDAAAMKAGVTVAQRMGL